MRVAENIATPIRTGLSFEQLFRQEDKGLIKAWEIGRVRATKNPDEGTRAKQGQLLPLIYQGGFAKKLKETNKMGTMHYLAMWQGLRGENLDLDTELRVTLTCTKFQIVVTYSFDPKEYLA